MKTKTDQSEELLYILFEGKSLEYGAFMLRKKNKRNSLTGIIVASTLVSLIYMYPLMQNWASAEPEPEIRQVSVEIMPFSELEAPPPIPQDQKPPEPVAEPPEVATKKYVKPELKPDEQVIEEELIPTVDELKTANPGTKTREGSGDILADYKPRIIVPDTPKEQSPPPPPPQKKEEVFNFVQVLPQFPGGEAQLQQFLVNNINYPFIASENGIQGTVVIQFVIDKEGNITEPVILRDIGGGCGEEALRVVGLMPKWIPGEQQGKKVAVRYTLPVRFKLVN
jgi:protein TonB